MVNICLPNNPVHSVCSIFVLCLISGLEIFCLPCSVPCWNEIYV